MSFPKKTLTLLLVLGSLMPASLLADRIILRNGQILNGQIINQNQGSVVIRTRDGVQTISKGRIARIQYGNFPDPDEERQKEEERRRQEELKRQQEQRRQEEERKRLEEVRRQEEQRKAEEERKRQEQLRKNEEQSSEDKDPTATDSGDASDSDGPSSWIPEFSASDLIWDPDLKTHRIRAGLSLGTVDHDWMGLSVIRTYRQVDASFSNGQLFGQGSLETRNGWHSTGELEYGLNRYFIGLDFSVSRQQGSETYTRLGRQRNLFLNNIETVFGNVTEIGTVQNDRMRWEEGRLFLGYQILYGGDYDVDFLIGFGRSTAVADVNYAGLATFDQNPDRQYRTYSVRSYSKMRSVEGGLRGIVRLPDEWLPGEYAPYLPDVEWEARYISNQGTFHFSSMPLGFSTLYGSRGNREESAIDYKGTGGSGKLGLRFALPYNLSLHVGGYGSTVLLKTQKVYNDTSDNDLQGSLRANIFPLFLKGLFTTRETQRASYIKIQWEQRF
ncbi:MAG: hypothetical protein CMN76_13455 [Spirochaetaceae bacterium]|nr:hypothetical protein [Spirochaetaceae bacterium]|tara:strand:- start:13223 stop:14722 length:1500 start_codon:yes stop_codon:yes gene_type:complete